VPERQEKRKKGKRENERKERKRKKERKLEQRHHLQVTTFVPFVGKNLDCKELEMSPKKF